MKHSKKLTIIVGISLCLVFLIVGTSSSIFSNLFKNDSGDTITVTKEEYERLQKYKGLDEIIDRVSSNFYKDVDVNEMIEGAKAGLFLNLDDPYSFYYTPEDFSKKWEDDEGEYAGVGMQILANYETQLCKITRVFKDTPAEKAGIRKGDILSKVEDLDVNAVNLTEAVNIMRGNVGEPVKIVMLRDSEEIEFDVIRDIININWSSSKMLDNNIGYIAMYEFSGDCADQFKSDLQELNKQDMQGLILDLRDNPGGWLEGGRQIGDIFIDDDVLCYIEYKDKSKEYIRTDDGKIDIPVVVLINENSASTSEILTGALRDHGIATVVGTTSFGKGIVQSVEYVGTEGAGMQYTIAEYFTPNGVKVHEIGIVPDITIDLNGDENTIFELGDMKDIQLKTAFDTLLEKIKDEQAEVEDAA